MIATMKRSKTELQKGALSLVAYAFIFASMGIFARYLSADYTIFQQVYLRIFAAFVLSYIIFKKDIDLSKLGKATKKEWLVIVVRGVLLYGMAVPLISQALLDTKYGSVSFLATLPFVALFGVIFLKEKLSVIKFSLITLAVIGLGFIAIESPSQLLSWGRGEVLAVLSGAAFGLSYISRRWHSSLFNNKELTTYIFVTGTASSLILSFGLREGIPMSWSWALFGVIVLAGFANVVNLLLNNYGFERVSGVVASNILTLQVFFGVAIGYVLYGEVLGTREWIGGTLIIISVVLMNKYGELQEDD